MIGDVRFERPLLRSPTTVLIDDPSPGINPLHYFASTVPPTSTFYHYVTKGGEWYFDNDKAFAHPIVPSVGRSFVREFARWAGGAKVKGKLSVVPYAAGLGPIDGKIEGVPDDQVKEFVSAVKSISRSWDVSPEVLTHTRAVDLDTMRLIDVSEHDWSQTQSAETLARYIAKSLALLRGAGIDASGVTSPCDFGARVEGEYARAVLEAEKEVLGRRIAWYFLHVDQESLLVPHRVVRLDSEGREAVVSIFASMNDAFWGSMQTNLPEDEWMEKALEPVLSRDGKRGRVAEQVAAGGWVTPVTHWQSLYSNGSRYGLHGLMELVDRVNRNLSSKVVWMTPSEIAGYLACAAAAVPRVTGDVLEVRSPFTCEGLTVSFEAKAPRKVTAGGRALRKTKGALSIGTWSASGGRVTVSIPRLTPVRGGYSAKLRLL